MTTKSILQPRDQAPDGTGASKGWGVGPLPLLATAGAGTVVVALGAALGLWYLPFIAGLVVGVLTFLRGPGFLRATVALTVVGPVPWAVVLILRSLMGDTIGGTARTVAGLAGLPPFAAVTILLTLLVALLEASVGNWLGRALCRLLTPGKQRPEEL
jgi:hypothetical protein